MGSPNSSSLPLPTHSRKPGWPHLVDVKANGQVLALALPARGPLWPLLDADQDFIFWLLDIEDVLQVWPRRERDTAVRPRQGRLAGSRKLRLQSLNQSQHLSVPWSLCCEVGPPMPATATLHEGRGNQRHGGCSAQSLAHRWCSTEAHLGPGLSSAMGQTEEAVGRGPVGKPSLAQFPGGDRIVLLWKQGAESLAQPLSVPVAQDKTPKCPSEPSLVSSFLPSVGQIVRLGAS